MKRTRCQRLDMNGKRCRKPSAGLFYVHENPEHSQEWFAVHICNDHADGRTKPANRRTKPEDK